MYIILYVKYCVIGQNNTVYMYSRDRSTFLQVMWEKCEAAGFTLAAPLLCS